MGGTARAREFKMKQAAILWMLATYVRGLGMWEALKEVSDGLDTRAQALAKEVGSDYGEVDMMFDVTGNTPNQEDLHWLYVS
jgi:hypothetical protein